MFRDLKASEIECRVSQVKEKGLMLLLYKDARCDMTILDETVTPMNWDREHTSIKNNAYCGVTIRKQNAESGQIEQATKWDAGSESNTEAVKGEASDSFKRACFNWGIGRELYTSPFIWVKASDVKLIDTGKKNKYGETVFKTYDKFYVSKVEITKKVITGLRINHATTRNPVFSWVKKEV